MQDQIAVSNETEDYYYRRAEAELKMAQAATVPAAVKAHYELANRYLEQLPKPGDDAVAVEQKRPVLRAFAKL
ncbi:MAG: hypothetical protein JWN21_325 [Sphingomonas bacterium]|uniref:hypothetical protein n=1 Tax=Sphingomonas bacterium TaxID=1895847 RepID=UPI002617FDDC|nr:hypothetical protein [Sphingomonas bacterium]MDB5694782.1 hypothetical protein [Sphingomonas bacterium]